MRQAGILAAAGIIALEGHTSRLSEDHARAKKIALELAKIPGIIVEPQDVEINLVFFTWPPAVDEKISSCIMEIFKRHKIIINPPDKGMFRFATHYWIGDADVDTILAASREAFKEGQTS